MGWIERQVNERMGLCENLCEKNFPKSAKIRKNRKKSGKFKLTISIAYNNLRRLGKPEVLTSNPWVGRSNRGKLRDRHF